jgi:predicted esterase
MHYLYLLLIIPVLVVIYIIYFIITMSVIAKKKICFPIPENMDITVHKDIIYTHPGRLQLGCDIYSPAQKDTPAPCVILFQGDAPDFILKDSRNWGIFQSYGRLLAAHGITAVAFTRRSSQNEKRYNDAEEDITALMDFIQVHASSYNIDKDRIILWTFSFGALLGISWALPRPKPYIKGIVSYYGLLASKNPRHSPVDNLGTMKSLDFPILLAKGEKDMQRIKQSNDLFYTIAKNKSIDITFLSHESGGHSFDVLNDNERTREIIKETLEFVKKCAGMK